MSALGRARSRPARSWTVAGLVLLSGALGGCTRFEDHVMLSLHAVNGCRVTWTSIARRGVNLVDSSGNVGSASASFRCRPDPSTPDAFLVENEAMDRSESGAASRRLGPRTTGAWSGSVRFTGTGDARSLVLDLHDGGGNPFVGNRRYENLKGNGETWFAQ